MQQYDTASILQDSKVFDEDHIPQKIISRKEQTRKITANIRRAKHKQHTINLYVWGNSGSGKTTVIRHILQKEFTKNNFAYVNCWDDSTKHKILESIMEQTGFFVHGAEPYSKLLKKLQKSEKRIVICLDECDKIRDKEILYSLVRCNCTIILIANKKDALSNIDSRIESRLSFENIEFEQYSEKEILKIMQDRILDGFSENVINDDLLSVVSARCGGDARTALQSVRDAAIRSEIDKSSFITPDAINHAVCNNTRDRIADFIESLNIHQKNIYEILKGNKRMIPSLQIYEKCKDMTPQRLPSRSYRHHIDRMERAGIIRSEGIKRWKSYEIVV